MLEGVINSQNFEIIRDGIASILLQELTNQKNLQNFDEEINIYSERTTPMSNDELLTINLNLESGDYNDKTQAGVAGKMIYNIDIYTGGYENEDEKGSFNSAVRLHRYIGLIRYILSHTTYRTLNMPLGVISGTSIDSFYVMESDLKQDSGFIKMSRMVFSVRVNESQLMEVGIELQENETVVKLHETEKGYIYKFIN